MAHRFHVLLLLAILVGCLSPAQAGVDLVEIAKVKKASALEGYVRDRNGDPVSGAVVAEVIDADNVVQRTTCDDKGYFKLSSDAKRKVHNLMISAPGFNPLLVHVKITPMGLEGP